MAQDNLSSIYSSSLARQLLKEKRVNRIYIQVPTIKCLKSRLEIGNC
jgi:hypothetical protein